MIDLGHGIWRWTLRHPEWHPRTEFGAEVGCYAVHVDGGTVLIDPLFDGEIERELDTVVTGEVVVAVTIPYHVRSSAEAVGRWGGTIVGHPDVQRRLPDGTPFHGDEDLPLGLVMHRVTRLKERPLELPSVRALAFGDRVVGRRRRAARLARPPDHRHSGASGSARPARRRCEHLLDVDFDRALVTHGEPVLQRCAAGAPGRIARRALVSPPDMTDHVYKSVEITGSSEAGVQQAIDNALAKAGKTLRNIDWFEVVGIRGGLADGKTYYQVTLKIGFRLED